MHCALVVSFDSNLLKVHCAHVMCISIFLINKTNHKKYNLEVVNHEVFTNYSLI